MKHHAPLLILGLVWAAGCSGSDPDPDPAPADAGLAPDSGAIPTDSGAAPADSGVVVAPDAGTPDSGAVDAGPPPADALVTFALIEDFGGDRVTGVEVCLWDVEADTEDCKTLDDPDGIDFRTSVGREIYFRVRDDAYVDGAYPFVVTGELSTFQSRLFTRATFQGLGASGGLAPDPTKGFVIAQLDLGGTQDPRLVHGVRISTDDPDAVVAYARADVTQGIDPGLSATSTGADGFAAAGLFNVAPGIRDVALVHPQDSACRIRDLPAVEGGAPYPVRTFADTLTLLVAACERADRGQKLCDVVAQDCPDPDAKCRTQAFRGINGSNEIGTLCSPPRGEGGLETSCERPTGEPGDDTCAPGLYCAYWGLPRSTPQARVCRQHCDLANPCPTAGDHCLGFGGRVPTEGACLPACDPFDDPCGPGQHCATASTLAERAYDGFLTCLFVGSGGAGDACANSEGCADGLSCLFDNQGNGACRALCGETRPCEGANETCVMLSGLPTPGVGFCR